MKITINDTELDLSEEELEELLEQFRKNGWWIANISFDFGDDQPFTEDVKMLSCEKPPEEIQVEYLGRLPDQQSQ